MEKDTMKNPVYLTAVIEKDLLSKLTHEAWKRKISRSELVRALVVKFLTDKKMDPDTK